MAILTFSSLPAKNETSTATLDKDELYALTPISGDAFWGNSINVKQVKFIYESSQGNQNKTLIFDTSYDPLWNYLGPYDLGSSYAVGDVVEYNSQLFYRIHANGGNVGDTPYDGSAFWSLTTQPTPPQAELSFSAKARDLFNLRYIVLKDYDNGELRLNRDAIDAVMQVDTLDIDLTGVSMAPIWDELDESLDGTSKNMFNIMSGGGPASSNIDQYSQPEKFTMIGTTITSIEIAYTKGYTNFNSGSNPYSIKIFELNGDTIVTPAIAESDLLHASDIQATDIMTQPLIANTLKFTFQGLDNLVDGQDYCYSVVLGVGGSANNDEQLNVPYIVGRYSSSPPQPGSPPPAPLPYITEYYDGQNYSLFTGGSFPAAPHFPFKVNGHESTPVYSSAQVLLHFNGNLNDESINNAFPKMSPTFVDGKFGKALGSFSDQNKIKYDFMAYSSPFVYDNGPNNGFTIEMFAKFVSDASGQPYQILIQRGNPGSSSPGDFIVKKDGTNLVLNMPQENITQTFDIASVIDDGLFHHVAVVYNNVSERVQLFLDGEVAASIDIAIAANPNHSLSIGASTTYSGFVLPQYTDTYFKGAVDDLRISDSALYSVASSVGQQVFSPPSSSLT